MRPPSRAPCFTSRFWANAQPRSMTPKTNRTKIGRMKANSTRVAPRSCGRPVLPFATRAPPQALPLRPFPRCHRSTWCPRYGQATSGAAVVHAGTSVGLELRLAGRRLRSSVSDESSRVPVPRRGGPSRESGRGLQLVEELAADWGVETTAAGKTVWFEVDLAARERRDRG